MTASVVWFRRALRVQDNPALQAARSAAERVACLFVVEPAWLSASPARASVLSAAVRSLREDLASRGAPLHLRMGPAVRTVPAFARETGASSVFADADVTPRARARDDAVRGALEDRGVGFEPMPGVFVRDPGAVLSPRGTPYKIFTPYHRRWREHPLRALASTPRALAGVEAASDPAAVRTLDRYAPAEAPGGQAALRRFLRANDYERTRHRLDGAGGSRLSPAFRFGTVSPLVAARAKAAPEAWTRQLAWRDFASDTLLHHPQLLSRSLRARGRWSRDATALQQWRDGDTGDAVVDAAMRQLATEGWISNRARMTVASFLVRDLGIDWRRGARHFMRTLIDGDPAVNAFNWQWVAGTGFDVPAPFWRLSPERQGTRYDPDGAWRHRWIA